MRAWVAVALLAAGMLLVPSTAARTQACAPRGAHLGSVAYVAAGKLHVVDLEACTDRLLAPRARPPVRWSPDGRFIAFGDGAVVSARGGRVTHPLGVVGWTWRPGSSELVGVTARGGLTVGGPGRPKRELLPERWGAGNPVFDTTGTALGLVRRRARGRPELWEVLWPGRTPQQVAAGRGVGNFPILATLSPGGGWVFWWSMALPSNSIAADGLPLQVKGSALGAFGPRIAATLLYPEFLSWCGSRLLLTAGLDRITTHRKRIVVARPPAAASGQAWRTHDLSRDRARSWISPACSPDRRSVAVSAARNSSGAPFGHERRAIWTLGFDGSRRRVTSPGQASDELPRWSRNGRYLLFVRTHAGRGSLRLVEVRSGRVFGPIAQIPSGIGYYGHYGWADATDWRR
jgi:hypothetical protein